MLKSMVVGVVILSLAGCAATLQTDVRPVVCPTSGKTFDGVLLAEKNRVGTELQLLSLVNDQGAVVAQASGSGRGIVAGMTDGALSAALHSGGLLGAAALIRPDQNTYSGGNSGSEATGGSGGISTASGGNASAKGGTAISGSVSNASASAKATASAKSWSKSQSKSSGGGWVPPGQDKK